LRATTDLLFGNKLMDVLLLMLGDKKGGFGWMASSPIGYYIYPLWLVSVFSWANLYL
jgi:hypothetical protein